MNSLTLIVAATMTNGIGQSSRLPWRLPQEMAYFARVTSRAPEGKKNAVIMGRNTWESIPLKFRPLPKRLNVVISRNCEYKLSTRPGEDDAQLCAQLEDALLLISHVPEIHRTFVIGGASLYRKVLDLGLEIEVKNTVIADRILLTRVLSPGFEGCDVYMPEFRELKNSEGKPIWQRAPHEELREWTGEDVAEGVHQEKGIEYEYQMWLRTSN